MSILYLLHLFYIKDKLTFPAAYLITCVLYIGTCMNTNETQSDDKKKCDFDGKNYEHIDIEMK